MKPRNKFEKRVAEINATLREDISVNDIEWFKSESQGWDFGGDNYCYFTLFTNIAELEVKRLYRGYRFPDKSTTHYFFVEIIREFSEREKKAYCAKLRQGMSYYYDSYCFNSDIELRDNRKNYYGYQSSWLFGLSCASHEMSDNNRVACEWVNPKELARVICNNPVAETLHKNNDELFGWLLWGTYAKQICRSITIAKRHGFVFNHETTALWFDMVRAILYCKKDYRNPVYVAPKDLRATHDKFITMRNNHEERRRREMEERKHRKEEEALMARLQREKAANEAYIKRRKRFYDMILTDGLIECRVLRDVQDFENEGKEMEHCVFRCKYYEKPYSLILSARIGNKRIETIEVDLSKYKVIQCYGKRDHFTMHHKRILDLINSQMDTIKAYNRNRVKKQMKIAV